MLEVPAHRGARRGRQILVQGAGLVGVEFGELTSVCCGDLAAGVVAVTGRPELDLVLSGVLPLQAGRGRVQDAVGRVRDRGGLETAVLQRRGEADRGLLTDSLSGPHHLLRAAAANSGDDDLIGAARNGVERRAASLVGDRVLVGPAFGAVVLGDGDAGRRVVTGRPHRCGEVHDDRVRRAGHGDIGVDRFVAAAVQGEGLAEQAVHGAVHSPHHEGPVDRRI